MGYSTDFAGHVEIQPQLNDVELSYLRRFAGHRPWDDEGKLRETCGSREPGSNCQWELCDRGHCLQWNGREKFYRSDQWMRYLIDTFLRPGAHASRCDDLAFDGFTFDHTCSGIVAASRRDTLRLTLIRVEANVVRTQVLLRGAPEPQVWGWGRDDTGGDIFTGSASPPAGPAG